MDFAKKYRNSKLLFALSISLLLALVIVWWFNVYKDKKEELGNQVGYFWMDALKTEEQKALYSIINKTVNRGEQLEKDNKQLQTIIDRKYIKKGDSTTLDVEVVDEHQVREIRYIASFGESSSVSISGDIDSLHQIRELLKNQDSSKQLADLYRIASPMLELSREFGNENDSLWEGLDIDVETLTFRLDTILDAHQLNLDYRIIVVDDDTKKDSKFASHASKGQRYTLELKTNVGLILSRMWLEFLLGTLVVIIITIAFYYILRSLYQEYKIAQIKDGLVSNIVHELRTPIFTVSAALEALQHFGALKDPQKTEEYLEISKNELNRLAILVERVLNTSFFEQGNINLQRETFNVKHLLATIALSLKLPLEKHRANLTINCKEIELNADKIHITNVLYNLVDNALKYSRENPKITINVLKENDLIKIEVQDNGIGIPAAYKDKIFDKFFRVPTDNQHDVKGYGLGLNYVAEIIRLHQAKIEVKSTEGQGTTFVLQFKTV